MEKTQFKTGDTTEFILQFYDTSGKHLLLVVMAQEKHTLLMGN